MENRTDDEQERTNELQWLPDQGWREPVEHDGGGLPPHRVPVLMLVLAAP